MSTNITMRIFFTVIRLILAGAQKMSSVVAASDLFFRVPNFISVVKGHRDIAYSIASYNNMLTTL